MINIFSLKLIELRRLSNMTRVQYNPVLPGIILYGIFPLVKFCQLCKQLARTIYFSI
jgi:hypothetical protein